MRSEFVVMGVLLGGCGMGFDMNVQPATPQVTASNAKSFLHVKDTLEKSCSFSSCHSPGGMRASAGLDLMTDTWLSLVNVPVRNARAGSEGMKLVKPCDPEHSFLFVKLTMSAETETAGHYGGHMPAANDPLPPEELQLIHDWIARGAKLAEPADVTGTTCGY